MNKIPCASQNMEAKTLPVDVYIFGCFGRLSPAAIHSADCRFLTPEWSGGSMFHPLSHIYTKTPFCCIETVTNDALNCQQVVFDWLWANAAPTLNTAFSLTNVHAKWWIHCFLIFISCNFNLWLTKMSLWSFLVFSGTTAKFEQP